MSWNTVESVAKNLAIIITAVGAVIAAIRANQTVKTTNKIHDTTTLTADKVDAISTPKNGS